MKKLFYALIPLTISIVLLIFGITNISKSRDVIVPAMGDPNWFELATEESHLKMSGIAMTVFGFIVLIMAVMVFVTIFVNVKHKDNTTTQVSEMMKKSLEETKETQSGQVKCEYCGATYAKTLSNCPGCGSRTKSKK